MNVALLDEEHTALEAALAFLDNCGDGGQDFSSLCDFSIDVDFSQSSDELLSSSNSDQSSSENQTSCDSSSAQRSGNGEQKRIDASTAQTCQKVAKRCKTGAPAVRRRTKNDLLELREQVLQLTALLGKLQLRKTKSSRGSTIRANGPRLPRLQVQGSRIELSSAVLERQKLQEAEALNLKLKVAWREQMKLTRRLESVFKKQISTVDLDFLMEAQVVTPLPVDPMGQDSSLLFARLHNYLETIYPQSASVSASISARDTSRVFSSSHVHHDMLLGETFEFTTNSPVECELRDLEAQIWGMLSNKDTGAQKPNVVSHDAREHTSAIYEHQFTQKLDCQFGVIFVNGVSVVRKYVEPHRVVICYTSLLMLAGTELTFKETGWLILLDQSDTNSDGCLSKPRVLLQTCYRMHPESSGSGTCALGDTAYFQNFIVQSQCESMRTQQLHLQSVLLDKFSSSPPQGAAQGGLPSPKTLLSGCFFSRVLNL